MADSTKRRDVCVDAARHDAAFGFWWGRYVIGLTDEELTAGAAGRAAMRAAEAAWAASGHSFRRAMDEHDRDER